LFLVNAREFLRDRLSVLLVLLLPVAFAAFLGLIFSEGGGSDFTLQLGIVDQDGGPASARFVEGLAAASSEQALALHTGTRHELLGALEQGDVHLVLLLPGGMTASLAAGVPVTVEVWYDATQSASAATGLSFVRTMLNEANLALSGAPHLLLMEARTVLSGSLRTIDLFMPGFLAIALLWLGLFGTALPLVQQRAAQVLRRLSVTPVRPATMLTAQVSWRVTVAILQAALFLLVGYLAFQVGIEGNKLLFLAAVLLGSLVFISLGYLLAGLATSEEGLIAMVQFVNFPLMLLSGGLFPVQSLPSFLKPLVALSPLTYLTDALGQLMVGAPALNPLWLDYAVLTGWLVLFLALGVKFWRWE
jgi:ABC-2 type transport system permease protein